MMIFKDIDDSVHTEASQNRKFERATKIKPEQILNFDKDNQTATFIGSSGSYNTTLNHCDCVDYLLNGKGKKPCKHMYRLAIECGLIDPNTEPWATYKSYSKIANSVKKKIDTLEISQMYKLSEYIDKNY